MLTNKKWLIVISLILLFSCSSQNQSSECLTVEEAIEHCDFLVAEWNTYYEKLCSQPRNEYLKAKFLKLGESVQSTYGCGSKYIKLSYADQNQVEDYALKLLNTNTHLKNLADGTIDCW